MTTPVDPVRFPDAALLSAAASGELDHLANALAAGAQLEARDDHGRSPLLTAAVVCDGVAVA